MFVIGLYNGLVTLRNRFKNAFAQIDVQLKRRYDLIPEPGRDGQGLHGARAPDAGSRDRGAQHRRQRQPARRGQPRDGAAIQGLAAAEAGLSGALGRLFALSEAYPDLKANQNMMQLSEELTSTENKIAFARQAFNDAVMSYNTRVESFPDNIIAGMFQFKAAELLQATESAEERKAPKVSFS